MSEGLMGRIAGRFARVEPRRRARQSMLGMLADLPRKNCWTIAKHTGDASPNGLQHLLIRRNRRNRRTAELAYYRCYSPRPVPLSTLVMVAGSRWTVEETFQSAKTLAGLDEHRVRRWDSWSRWVTHALLAHAFLAVAAALERRNHDSTDDGTSPDGLIPLTDNEIQRLFTALTTQPARDLAHRLRWSTWRRRHQARARQSHCHHQAALQP